MQLPDGTIVMTIGGTRYAVLNPRWWRLDRQARLLWSKLCTGRYGKHIALALAAAGRPTPCYGSVTVGGREYVVEELR